MFSKSKSVNVISKKLYICYKIIVEVYMISVTLALIFSSDFDTCSNNVDLLPLQESSTCQEVLNECLCTNVTTQVISAASVHFQCHTNKPWLYEYSTSDVYSNCTVVNETIISGYLTNTSITYIYDGDVPFYVRAGMNQDHATAYVQLLVVTIVIGFISIISVVIQYNDKESLQAMYCLILCWSAMAFLGVVYMMILFKIFAFNEQDENFGLFGMFLPKFISTALDIVHAFNNAARVYEISFGSRYLKLFMNAGISDRTWPRVRVVDHVFAWPDSPEHHGRHRDKKRLSVDEQADEQSGVAFQTELQSPVSRV